MKRDTNGIPISAGVAVCAGSSKHPAMAIIFLPLSPAQ